MSFSQKSNGRVSISFDNDPGYTEQSHKKMTDIHDIMRRYEKTGIIDHLAKYEGKYMQMPTNIDFKTAMDVVANANSMFETLPSKIRNKCKNDPARFLEWIQDNKNYDDIKASGLDVSHLEPPAQESGVKPPLSEPVATQSTEVPPVAKT